jgi:hypothetical protein
MIYLRPVTHAKGKARLGDLLLSRFYPTPTSQGLISRQFGMFPGRKATLPGSCLQSFHDCWLCAARFTYTEIWRRCFSGHTQSRQRLLCWGPHEYIYVNIVDGSANDQKFLFKTSLALARLKFTQADPLLRGREHVAQNDRLRVILGMQLPRKLRHRQFVSNCAVFQNVERHFSLRAVILR